MPVMDGWEFMEEMEKLKPFNKQTLASISPVHLLPLKTK
jgi:hypothetical protein